MASVSLVLQCGVKPGLNVWRGPTLEKLTGEYQAKSFFCSNPFPAGTERLTDTGKLSVFLAVKFRTLSREHQPFGKS